MNVYLARHGAAVDLGWQGVSRDEDRMLSAEGRALTRAAARGLLKVPKFNVARIVASPLARAVETARIFADELGLKGAVEVLPLLAPGTDAPAVAKWLGAQPPSPLMLVGHMPDLSDLASCLVCSHGSMRSAFRKAAVMNISFEDRAGAGRGCIEWLLQPGTLRALAG